jgi:hypothetical protein
MHGVIVASLLLVLAAGGAAAQSSAPPPSPAPALPKAAAPSPTATKPAAPAATSAVKVQPDPKKVAKENIAECMRLWDAATHMSRQEWARTCERIQTRLENLRIENLNLMGIGVGKKAGPKRQGSLNSLGVWNWA